MRLFCSIVAAAIVQASPTLAADRQELLYDVLLDMDRDGKQDRAALVLVRPGRNRAEEISSEQYFLSSSERADLFIYLGGGDKQLDVTAKPTFRKRDIFNSDDASAFGAPTSNAQGSLYLESGTGTGSNQYFEKLTIVYRRGTFWVGGFTQDWDTRSYIGQCDFNFLTGEATKMDGPPESQRTSLKGTYRMVKLEDWQTGSRPTVCEGE